jgi:hypothetical protein
MAMRASGRIMAIENTIRNLCPTSIIPTITLAIRKDHKLFDNKNGTKMINNLYKSYLSYKTLYPQFTIPFFLPRTFDTQKYINQTKNNEINHISIESCFALNIEYNNEYSTQYNKNASLTTVSSRNYDRNLHNSNLYPAEIVTHIKQNNNLSYVKNNIHFLLNCSSNVLPQRMNIDSIIITDNTDCKYPVKLDVVIASDKELNIDDEWDNIQDWAKKSG